MISPLGNLETHKVSTVSTAVSEDGSGEIDLFNFDPGSNQFRAVLLEGGGLSVACTFLPSLFVCIMYVSVFQ